MKKIFAANWKLHKNPAETRRFLTDLRAEEAHILAEMLIFPPASSWEAAATSLVDSSIGWGAQNVWTHGQGAFTGENSAQVLKDLGGRFALVGHSERRQIFKEGDALLAEKVSALQVLDVTPVFCVGETLAEREAGQTASIIKRQLIEGLAKADAKKNLIVAYEPVWAIGTGRVATPEQVAETHRAVFGFLKEMRLQAPLLYGGSVKPDNASGLLKIDHVDGFLIGGASLEVSSFLAIVRS